TVDFNWLVDHFLSMSGQDMSAEQREAARGFMTPTSMTVQTLVGVVVVSLLIYAIVALYLHIVAKVGGNTEMDYGRWFSLVSWTSLPSIVIVIGMILNYGLSDGGQVAPENVAVTNLGNLLGLDVSEPGWQRTLASFDII